MSYLTKILNISEDRNLPKICYENLKNLAFKYPGNHKQNWVLQVNDLFSGSGIDLLDPNLNLLELFINKNEILAFLEINNYFGCYNEIILGVHLKEYIAKIQFVYRLFIQEQNLIINILI